MNRLSALLLLSALLAAATAAPAPPPKPRPWVTGWDKPQGEGRFEPRGDKLTFSHPGLSKSRDTEGRLLRDVEGDFAMQVRLGEFRGGAAGIVLSGGPVVSLWSYARVLYERPTAGVACWVRGAGIDRYVDYEGGEKKRPTHLRLERRGGSVLVSFGDGKAWTPLGRAQEVTLPLKVKVGVTVSPSSPGPFKVVFDEFKLTPLGR